MKFKGHMNYTILLMIVVPGIFFNSTFNEARAQVLEKSAERTNDLIVMLKGQFEGQIGTGDVFGAGIIFGRGNGKVYIVTANHVVRKGNMEVQGLQVMFRGLPDQWFNARIMKHVDRSLDLAVLSVEGLAKHGFAFCRLPLNQLGDTSRLRRGEAVYPVGSPNGSLWGMPVTSDRIAQITGKEITFQSMFISQGHSGGGLLTERGALIGMIKADQPPFGRAINFKTIDQKLRQWEYPVQLRRDIANVKSPLHLAAANGNVNEVKRLLYDCADVNAKDKTGNIPLHIAASHKQAEIVKLFLDAGVDINVWTNEFSPKTPLHIAAEHGSLEVAKVLIAYGADVNSTDKFGRTPLHSAAEHGAVKIVQLLLSNGSDVNTKKQRSVQPLHLAVDQGNFEAVKILLANGANVNADAGFGRTSLYSAAKHGDIDIVKLLLANGANTNVNNVGPDSKTPLHIAVEQGNLDIVKVLLASGANVNVNTRRGTALHLAAQKGTLDIVKFLLANGADVNASNDKKTPLHFAIDRDAVEIVKILVVNGADVNAKNSQYNYSKTPLQLAVESESIEIISTLLANGSNVNEKVLNAVAEQGSREIVKVFLDAGVDVNTVTPYGKTLLHLAVEQKETEMVKMLLAADAHVNAKDDRGYTPLIKATEGGRIEIVKLLLAAGVNVNLTAGPYGQTPLQIAARGNNVDIAKLLLNAGASIDGALNQAVLYAQVELVKLLLVDAHVSESILYQAIQNSATRKAMPEIFKLLLAATDNVDEEDKSQRTALHWAVVSEHLISRKLL